MECTCCGRKLNHKTRVQLELDQRIDCYHDFEGVPEDKSQGWFDFGLTCANKERAKAKKALKEAGL